MGFLTANVEVWRSNDSLYHKCKTLYRIEPFSSPSAIGVSLATKPIANTRVWKVREREKVCSQGLLYPLWRCHYKEFDAASCVSSQVAVGIRWFPEELLSLLKESKESTC